MAGAFQTTWTGLGDAFVSRLDLLPDGISRFGTSTPACRGPLGIGVTNYPVAGMGTLGLLCGAAPPWTTGLLLVGAGQHLQGLPILGATLHIDPLRFFLAQLVAADGIGACEVHLAMPHESRGTTWFTQFLWVNTPTCGGLGTLSSSPAMRVDVR
jgi:hypothetical protein